VVHLNTHILDSAIGMPFHLKLASEDPGLLGEPAIDQECLVESEGRWHASRIVFRIAGGSKQLVGFDRQLGPPYLVVFCELIGENYDGRWPDR
jgi:hypothetical protein